MFDSRTGKSLDNLREAFIALEKAEARPSHADTSPCLTLIRLSKLANNASAATLADIRHLKKCRRCTVRLSAMQKELGTDAETKFETAVTTVKRSLSRFSDAERFARQLFHHLHVHRGEPDRMFTWQHVHGPVLALRGLHSAGDEEDAESIVAMTSIAVSSAVSDVLTPFAQDLDAAWPVVTMMLQTGAETSRLSTRVSSRFAREYVDIALIAPVPLKGAFTYGLRTLLNRSPQLEYLALDIAAHFAGHDDPATESILTTLSNTEAPQLTPMLPIRARRQADQELLTMNGWLNELDERLRVRDSFSGIVGTVQKYVSELVAQMLEDRDSTSVLQRLLRTRHYVSNAVSRMSGAARYAFEYCMGDFARLLMERAQRADRQFFIATNVLSAIGPNPSVIRVMTELLDTPDIAMRQALFVYFLDAVSLASADGPFRFTGEGSDWVFEGTTTHPLTGFGNRAAAMAKDDPEIAALIQWSLLHPESHTGRVKKVPAKA
jgi:hypothetical protein